MISQCLPEGRFTVWDLSGGQKQRPRSIAGKIPRHGLGIGKGNVMNVDTKYYECRPSPSEVCGS